MVSSDDIYTFLTSNLDKDTKKGPSSPYPDKTNPEKDHRAESTGESRNVPTMTTEGHKEVAFSTKRANLALVVPVMSKASIYYR